MVTHAQLEEAKQYADQSIKNGSSEKEDWEGLTDEEFVQKARDDEYNEEQGIIELV